MEVDMSKRLLRNWKKVLCYALLMLVIVSGIAVKIGGWKGRAEADFVAASRAFLHWDQISEKRGEDFVNLQNLIKKHPELRPYYDGQIGQKLLALRDAEGATPYVERTLKRTGQPYYSDYARTSLKVSRGDYLEALGEARKLKENLLKDEMFWENEGEGSSLFAFNLLRIATLCQELGDQEELGVWKEIKQYGGFEEGAPIDEKIGQRGFKQLLSHFTVQEVSLLDYIQTRKEELSRR